MAQTEMMLRLLMDGKIVGYEFKDLALRKYRLCTMVQYKPIEENIFFDEIDHDSFEYGIKIGNKWWFEGDIIEFIWTDVHGEGGLTGVIAFRDMGFGVYEDGEYVEDLYSMINQYTHKCIGNIHKEKNND